MVLGLGTHAIVLPHESAYPNRGLPQVRRFRYSFFNTLIEDGSDDLIPVFFIPDAMEGIPRTVEIDFLYY